MVNIILGCSQGTASEVMSENNQSIFYFNVCSLQGDIRQTKPKIQKNCQYRIYVREESLGRCSIVTLFMMTRDYGEGHMSFPGTAAVVAQLCQRTEDLDGAMSMLRMETLLRLTNGHHHHQ